MFTSPTLRKCQVRRQVHLKRDPSLSVPKEPQHPSLAHPCASLAQEELNTTQESPPLAVRTQPQPPNPVLHPVRHTPFQTAHTLVRQLESSSVYIWLTISNYNRLDISYYKDMTIIWMSVSA